MNIAQAHPTPDPLRADPRSHGLWAETAGPTPVCPPLAEVRNVDVAIVGAGYTGLSAALHLAQSGLSCAIVEAREPGFGGAGRNVGLVNAGMWVTPEAVMSTLPAPWGDRLLSELGAGPARVFDLVRRHGMDCQAVPNGTLHCAVGQAGWDEISARAAQWQARGADVVLLDEQEAAARIGSTAYRGALLDRRAGTIQPLAYARGLARAAQAAGATIHGNSPVTAIAHDGRGWRVATGQGALLADWLIVATDAYGQGPTAQVRAEQIHLPYFNIATEPLTADQRAAVLPGLEGAWDTVDVLTSFRLDAAGRLVWGSVGALAGVSAAVHRAWARRAMARVFPMLAETPFASEWFGQIGMTTDNLPRFHTFGPRAYGVSGYNGRGISPGTVFGACLADLVTGRRAEGDLPLPLTDVALPTFRAVRELSYAHGATLVHAVSDRF